MPSFEIDAKDLAGLGRELRSAALRVRMEVDKTVAKIGLEVATEAKALAGKHSRTIPGTIRFRMIPGAAIVQAGNQATPIAALFEMGNKKSRITEKTFRHPVFGNREVWVQQPKHPYLRPVLAADRKRVTAQMERAWESALRGTGLERPSLTAGSEE